MVRLDYNSEFFACYSNNKLYYDSKSNTVGEYGKTCQGRISLQN